MNDGKTWSPWCFSRSVKTASTSGCRARKATSQASLSGCQRSSESRNEMSCPEALLTPRLRAAETPACRPMITCSRGSASAASRTAVSSVEPSSTTISSRSRKRWASTLRTASSTMCARLYVGMTTDTVMPLTGCRRRTRPPDAVLGVPGRRRSEMAAHNWVNGCDLGTGRLTSGSGVAWPAAAFHSVAMPCSASGATRRAVPSI